MTITFTLPNSGNIGPGEQITVDSDFIGPLPTGTKWIFNYWIPDLFGNLYAEWEVPAQGITIVSTALFIIPKVEFNLFLPVVPSNGASVLFRAQLVEPPSTVIDQGTVTAPWSTTEALAQMIYFLNSGSSPDVTAILAAVQKTFPTT